MNCLPGGAVVVAEEPEEVSLVVVQIGGAVQGGLEVELTPGEALPPEVEESNEKGASIYDVRTEGGGGLTQKKM